MKWLELYEKIGKQHLKVTQKSDVIAVINDKEIPLIIKFKKDGSPYLISKKEYNYNQCRQCYNYNIGDGYDDILKCYVCKYYNK